MGKIFLFMVVMGIVSFVNANYAYADVGMDYLIKHNVMAKVYNTNEYSAGGEGVVLSNSGASIENWNYKESRFLQIDILVDANQNEVHVVELKLAPIFYVSGDINVVPTGYSKVENIKYDKVPCNSNQYNYTLKNGNGTFKYYLKPNMTRASIQVELRYDPVLWDKFKGLPLTEEGVNPIEISLYHEKSVIDNTKEVNASKIKVSKATSGVGLLETGSITYRRIWNNSRWNPTSNFYQYKDKTARFLMITTEQGREYIYKYFKKMTVEIDVPYYEDDGKKIYVGYKKDTIRFDGVTGADATKINLEEAREDKLIFSMDGYYAPDDNFVMVDFVWPKGYEPSSDVTEVRFNGGRVKLHVTTNAGNEKTMIDTNMGYIEYTMIKKENVTVGNITFTNTLRKNYPDDEIVTKLGTFRIGNYGSDDSTKKDVNVKFNEKHLVTSMTLPTDVEMKQLNITYTLKDEDGKRVYLNKKGDRVRESSRNKVSSWEITINNRTYNSSEFDNTYTHFNRTMLDSKHKKYYFDTIEYTIKNIRSRTFLFDSGDTAYSPSGAGTFYGKLRKDAVAGETLKTNITLESPEGSGISTYKADTLSNVVSTKRATYGVNGTNYSKTSIKAGESFTTTGTIFNYYTYYWSDCTWIKDLRVALVLPKGVSIDKDNMIFRTSKSKEEVKVEKVSMKEYDEKYNVWLIDLDDDVYIGYHNDKLEQIAYGSSMTYSIKLDTDIYMDTISMYTNEMVYVVANNQENYIETCAKGYKTKDIYDIDEDGNTSEYIGCARVQEGKSCVINGEPPKLNIDDELKVFDKDGNRRDNECIALISDTVEYKLSIRSINDGSASSFDYYIPIPKKGASLDDYLYFEDEVSFDLNLLDKVSLDGDDLYEIKYTTETGLTYEQAREKNYIWNSAEELIEKGMPYADVTMIKVLLKSGTIEKGMETNITLKLGYLGMDLVADMNKHIKWKSSGYYDFDDNVKFISGHFSTNGVRVEIIPDPSLLTKIEFLDETDSLYYMYDVQNYEEVAISEDIGFFVSRPGPVVDVLFTISESDEFYEESSYIPSSKIILLDEAGNRITATDNTYNLKTNKKYILRISKLHFGVDTRKNIDAYLFAKTSDVLVREKVTLARVTAFIQH